MQTQTMKLRELTIRYAVRKDHDGQPVVLGREFGRPADAAAALMALLQDEPAEVFEEALWTKEIIGRRLEEGSRGIPVAGDLRRCQPVRISRYADACSLDRRGAVKLISRERKGEQRDSVRHGLGHAVVAGVGYERGRSLEDAHLGQVWFHEPVSGKRPETTRILSGV